MDRQEDCGGRAGWNEEVVCGKATIRSGMPRRCGDPAAPSEDDVW